MAFAASSTILLATDLSEGAGAATDEALALARRLKTDLLVLSVIDSGTLRLPSGRYRRRVDQERDARAVAARVIVERGRAEGVAVTLLIWVGDPGESIVEAARSENPGMVVIGSRPRGMMARLGIGRVSDMVVRHAPCPVLVVRAVGA